MYEYSTYHPKKQDRTNQRRHGPIWYAQTRSCVRIDCDRSLVLSILLRSRDQRREYKAPVSGPLVADPAFHAHLRQDLGASA